MRELDLRNYMVTQKVMNPIQGEKGSIELPYFVKDSILNLLFLPQLELRGAALVKQNILAIKIEACGDDFILLEEEEYNRVLDAAVKYPAQQRADVTLIDRIMNQTKQVEIPRVEEKKNG